MKKLAIMAMLAMAANLAPSLTPAAHAAAADEALARLLTQNPAVADQLLAMVTDRNPAIADQVLATVAAQNPTAAKVQDLLALKQDLEQGGKTAVVSRVTQAALDRAGQGQLATVVTAVAGGGNIRAAVESTVRQEVAARLGPYGNSLALLAELLQNSGLSPQAARDNEGLAGAPANYRKMLAMTATAYAPGPLDNGRWNDLTHLGGKVRKGVVAVDPKVVPLGTRLWVEGYGEAVAEDTGSAIKGNRIDLAFNTRPEALAYGIKNVRVYVLE